MSQVRKLLKGNLVPKAQQGYKFKLDSQEYNVTEDQLKEIDNQIALLDPQHRRFLGNWTNAIKEGNSKGNRASNTVSENMLTNIGGKDKERLKKQKGSFWETVGEKDSYYAKEAVGEALNITASVLNRTVPKQVEAPSKTKISNSNINLDFNDGVFSLTAGENLSAKNRIKQIIEHIAAGDNSKYDVSDWNNLDAIKVLLENNPNYADEMWERMSKSGYKYSAEDEDFLRNFGINYGLTASTGNVVSAGSTTGSGSVGSGTVSSGVTGASTGNTKVGDIITILDKDYKVTGFKDNGDPILEEIVNDVENNENQTEVETEQQEVNSNWNPEIIEYAGPMTGIGPKYDLTYTPTKRSLELMEVGTVTLPFDRWGRFTGRVKQRLMKDVNGTLYSIGDDGIICLINSDYVKDILAGKQITYNDWHKNTKVFVRSRKEGGIISKSKTDSFKSKFKNVIKGQNGINPNWKVPGWQIEESTPAWKQGSLYPDQSKTSVSLWPEGYDPNRKWNELTAKTDVLSQKIDASIRANHNGYNPYWVPGEVLSTEKDQEEVGGYPKNISGYYKHLIPALSLARFGLNAHFQNKYRDQAVDALNAGRFSEIAAWANLPRQDNPALDRALQQIRSERMTGIKPVTSDLIANSALQNEREAKLYDRENDIIGRQSQFQSEAAKEALDIMNHNIANQVAVANSNRARNASIDSAIKQQDMILTQRRAQSWENLGLEIQNNLKKDRDVMLNYGKAQEQAKLQKEYDRTIDQIFGSQARNEYNSLDADEAVNYTDYDDYLNKKYNSIYRQNIERINKAQEDRINTMRKWLYLNGLNYSYPTFITGKSSPYGYKKGGYLRGSTRYTLEPDERIWIDNNKATHQAIAKLSDNTIKLLLRALK